MPGRRVKVFINAEVQKFGPSQATKLLTTLQRMDAVTVVQSISMPTELQLRRTVDGAAETFDGYRLTASAFSQVAQLLSPGLSKFMPDITGTLVLPDARDRMVLGDEAIKFWNGIVDTRFPLFSGQRLIRNTQIKTIEGMVGHKHQFLGNWELYDEARKTLQHIRPETKLAAAMLVGRRFSVWFRDQRVMFSKEVDGEEWEFFPGYYFTNGEATGTSVRGTLAVYSKAGTCLGPYKRYGDRVTHTGQDFLRRMTQMVTTLVEEEIPVDTLADGVNGLLAHSLEFKEGWSETERKDRIKKLTHSLSLLGVAKTHAQEIVDYGLTVGRDDPSRSPVYDLNHLYARRTLLDLFIATLWYSRTLDLTRREKVAQAAFEMLTGRFLL